LRHERGIADMIDKSVWTDLNFAKRLMVADEKLRNAPASLTDADIENLDKYYGNERQARSAREAARAKGDPQANRKRAAVVAALRPKGITFRTAELEQLNDHAIELALLHDVSVKRRTSGNGGSACFEQRLIETPPVTNEAAYAVFIHELGHIVDPEADSRQYPNIITKTKTISIEGEVGAWRWAVKNALRWTAEMQNRLYEGLTGYQVHAASLEQRDLMADCLKTSCLRIVDRPWTFAELDARCAAIRRLGAEPTTSDVTGAQDVWQAGETYLPGARVQKDGYIFRCVSANNGPTTSDPSVDPLHWRLENK
jgi:hypothetical protein